MKEILAFFKLNEAAFAILNQHLAHNTWVAAGRFSAADLACCSYLYYPEAFGFESEAYVHIQAWLERIKNIPGWMHPYDLLPKAHPMLS